MGTLYLLPNLLHEEARAEDTFVPSFRETVRSLQGLIAESEKKARRFLRLFLSHEEMQAVPLALLNEHSETKEVKLLLEPILRGERWGLISDAGLPCVADPGSDLVKRAHLANVHIETFVGPSSLLMALQLSGCSGQKFSFEGYLPRETPPLEKCLIDLEKRSLKERSSHIWIEAPYRSEKLFSVAKSILQPSTQLCLAVSLMSDDARAVSLSIAKWREKEFPLGKEPTVFVMQA